MNIIVSEDKIDGNALSVSPLIIREKIDKGKDNITIFAFSAVEDVVIRALINENDFFSKESITACTEAITPFFLSGGYEPDKHCGEVCYEFSGYAETESEGAVFLTGKDQKRNDTTFHLDDLEEHGCLMCGVVEHGRIVSAAVTHVRKESEKVADVTVETVPGARKKGYAVACLKALSSELKKRGYEIRYRCRESNKASYATAMAAGLTVTYRYSEYIGRKKNGF